MRSLNSINSTEYPSLFLVSLFLFYIFISLAQLSSIAIAQEYQNTHRQGISVLGECLTTVAQDRGSVSVSSIFPAPSTQRAAEGARQKHDLIKQRIRALNLPDFSAETGNFSISEDCTQRPLEERKCSGFRAYISTSFETSDLSRVGEIIDAASAAGASEISNLYLFVSQAKLKETREKCLEVAVKNSAQKAQVIADAAGVKLGKILSVDEEGGGRSGPIHPRALRSEFMEAATLSRGNSTPQLIDSKPLEVNMSVSAVYGIEIQ
jgi:uncharacterized protein YggE